MNKVVDNITNIKQQRIQQTNPMLEGNNQQNIDNASIQDMISLLKQYQKMCLDKLDFSSAEQAKNKIEFLKTQEVMLKRQKLQNQQKQNIQSISKQGEEQIKMFQQHWDEHLQELIETLKQVQKNLQEHHEKQLIQLTEKLQKQQAPKMKFSSQVLDLRKYLRNLIKVKNYKQAQVVKNKLQAKQKQQTQKWCEKHEQKKRSKIEVIKRRQLNELNALRTKAQATFNQSIKQRDQKFQILLKKNRKRRIQSGKISRERLKTKTALLNESKSYMTVSKN